MLVIFLHHSLRRKAVYLPSCLGITSLKSLQVSPTKEWWAQVPETPSLSGSLWLVNLPGSLPKAEAGEPARNPAGIRQSPTSALLKWKQSVQNVLISANQQVPVKLHSNLLLWKNGPRLRWSFPIFLWKKCLREFSWSALLKLRHGCIFFSRSPPDKETCIALYKQIDLPCKPDLLFLPHIFHRRQQIYFVAKLFFQSGSVLFHNTSEPGS